jgi:triacylglycerol lipase
MNRIAPNRRGFLVGAGSMAMTSSSLAQSLQSLPGEKREGLQSQAANDPVAKSRMIKSRNLVFVHGIFGWGPNELGPLPYWGKALSQFDPAFYVHEAKCGPVSSFHDRACELFAQIRGGAVDYGEDHSKAAGHARISPTLNFAKGFVKNWSADNPVVLIAHSAGAHTCLQLQMLLASDFWSVGSNADWIEAVVCVAGVLNGSTLTYKFGCDTNTGLLTGAPERLIDAAVSVANWGTKWIEIPAWVPSWVPQVKVKPWLDHWKGNTNTFVMGTDNLAYDLTLQGCRDANEKFHTNTNTYYLSLVSGEEEQDLTIPFFDVKVPFAPKNWGDMNILLRDAATFQAHKVDFTGKPIPNWGTTDDLKIEAWRRTDGAVSSISQRYPFTHHDEPLGGEGIFSRQSIELGKWYFEHVENAIVQRFDHLDPVAGMFVKPRVWGAHEKLYQMLSAKFLG